MDDVNGLNTLVSLQESKASQALKSRLFVVTVSLKPEGS